MGSSQLPNPVHVRHKRGLNFLLLYKILIVLWLICLIHALCCKLESCSYSDLFPHQTPFQTQADVLTRSCSYFCCALLTLRLVCIAVKVSKSCRFCTATPLSQQSGVPPALLVQVTINEYMGKGFRDYPQTSERFEHVFIYRKRSVVHSQTTELGFGGFFCFPSLGRVLMCVWRVMSSGEHPNKAESKGGGRRSLGWFPWGTVLDPDQFGRLNRKQHSGWCKNV